MKETRHRNDCRSESAIEHSIAATSAASQTYIATTTVARLSNCKKKLSVGKDEANYQLERMKESLPSLEWNGDLGGSRFKCGLKTTYAGLSIKKRPATARCPDRSRSRSEKDQCNQES